MLTYIIIIDEPMVIYFIEFRIPTILLLYDQICVGLV